MVFPRRIQAVVFDMDGLLVDTEALIRDVMVELAEARGASFPHDVFQQMVGLTNEASDEIARAHFGPDFPLEALYADVSARVHAACEFRGQGSINHAVALDPALPFEGIRHDIDAKVRLATRAVAGMAFMQMRLVDDLQAFRRESFAQLVGDSVLCGHVCH